MDDFIDVQLSYVQMHLSSLEYTLSAKKVNSKYNRCHNLLFLAWHSLSLLQASPTPRSTPRLAPAPSSTSTETRSLSPTSSGKLSLSCHTSCHSCHTLPPQSPVPPQVAEYYPTQCNTSASNCQFYSIYKSNSNHVSFWCIMKIIYSLWILFENIQSIEQHLRWSWKF